MAMRKVGTSANNNVQGYVVANQEDVEKESVESVAEKESKKKKD